MMRRYIGLLGLCLSSLSFASSVPPQVDEMDLYFREAFYYARLGNYLEAIARLDAVSEPFVNDAGKSNSDPLHFQVGDIQLSMCDFELSYRMYQRAESVLKEIAGSNADQSVRNEAAFRLARMFLQNGEANNALKSIEQITGKIPEDIRDDEQFLRSQIYMTNGDLAGAVRLLQKLQNSKNYRGFASYNLGVALIKIGQEQQGLDQLDKAGEISGDDEVGLSMKDKANLALGVRLIDAKQPEIARKYLERIRLDGPFSNKALLGLGWAEVTLGRFDSALVPWSVLTKRDVVDASVQEGLIGVSYAYAKLNLPGKAVKLYSRALSEFEKELSRLESSIGSVREGRLLQALLREDLRQRENWATTFKSLPAAPETFYLPEMMVSNNFQDALGNYLDLDDLSRRLKSWGERLDALPPRQGRSGSRNDQEYGDKILQLENRIQDSVKRVNSLRSGQGKLLETMVINELEQRRMKILEYQAHARIALAESYERASKVQVGGGK